MNEMRIYISGGITGLNKRDVRRRFLNAENFLLDMGFCPVNPLKNGLSQLDKWEEHMIKDIELLLTCDAIYILDNWEQSIGASIEHDIAVRTNKAMLFESTNDNILIISINQAIHDVMGLKFSEYNLTRRRECFYARMLFFRHCVNKGISIGDLSRYTKRSITNISYHIDKYDDEIKYNKHFSELDTRIRVIIAS